MNIVEWRIIPDFPNYAVNIKGEILNIKTHRKLKERSHNQGYKKVMLSNNGKTKQFYIHRLVAQAFIPNPANLEYVNHIDENKDNNHVSNLEWVSARNNVIYSISNVYEALRPDGYKVSFLGHSELKTAGFNPKLVECVANNEKLEYRGYQWRKVGTKAEIRKGVANA
ncbi:HNH endonuclease [Enterococcus phage vB_Efs1_KEN01]